MLWRKWFLKINWKPFFYVIVSWNDSGTNCPTLWQMAIYYKLIFSDKSLLFCQLAADWSRNSSKVDVSLQRGWGIKSHLPSILSWQNFSWCSRWLMSGYSLSALRFRISCVERGKRMLDANQWWQKNRRAEIVCQVIHEKDHIEVWLKR